MEIYGNPRDLHFVIQGNGETKYAFAVNRGSGHYYKPMLSTTPFFATREEAVGEIRNILHTVLTHFQVPTTASHEPDDPKLLGPHLVNWVMRELDNQNEVETSQAPAAL